jgi:hypothetical protein
MYKEVLSGLSESEAYEIKYALIGYEVLLVGDGSASAKALWGRVEKILDKFYGAEQNI